MRQNPWLNSIIGLFLIGVAANYFTYDIDHWSSWSIGLTALGIASFVALLFMRVPLVKNMFKMTAEEYRARVSDAKVYGEAWALKKVIVNMDSQSFARIHGFTQRYRTVYTYFIILPLIWVGILGIIRATNTLLDQHPEETHWCEVCGKRVSSDSQPIYYVKVKFCDLPNAPAEFSVSKSVFDRTAESGQRIRIATKAGRLGFRWVSGVGAQ
jgi:ribosomal protein L34